MRCSDCGLNEAVKGDDLCEGCRREIEAISNLTYRIPWRKYDPENPPAEDVKYLVSDGYDTAFGYFSNYDTVHTWYPDDCSSFCGDDVTHYAPINLPGEE